MRRYSLYNGDCRFLLDNLPERSVDVVITDPPFDAKTHSGARYGGDGKGGSLIDFAPFTLEDLEYCIPQMLHVSRRWVISFCSLEMLGIYKEIAGPAYVRGGVWVKPDGAPQFTGDRPGQGCEGIAIMHRAGTKKHWNGGGQHSVWSCNVERKDRCHPTQKPVSLMRRLVNLFAEDDEIVFDPFMGSGSTGVAALSTGKKFLGSEISTEYFATAEDRLAASLRGLSLLDFRAGQTAFGF